MAENYTSLFLLLLLTFALCNDTPQKGLQTAEGEPKKSNVLQQADQVQGSVLEDLVLEAAQHRLLEIYKESIRPLEQAYRFADLNRDAISEGEMLAKPMILFLGPWSTGKSTMINYILKNEQTNWKLHTGAEPTTSDFTMVTYGETARIVKGIQLVSDKTKHYTPLQKFGLNFLERFQGVELPAPLLKQVTLVDTPGIIENKKQQERGYPFNDVCQWFIDRAQLIFLVFDPSKLDIGSELEMLFRQLKGHEAKLRLILNKADTVTTQELMRVYGALFWSLAPLINLVEPPRVYVGSMWSQPYQPTTMHTLFEEEETSLSMDLQQVIRYQLEYKIAATRRHAFLVRLHALSVDKYLSVFTDQKGLIFGDNDKLWQEIINSPEKFSIPEQLVQHEDVSVHDLPTAEMYQQFFKSNSLSKFRPLSYHCPFWSLCHMDRLVRAINQELPDLLQDLRSGNITTGQCSKDGKNC